MTSKRDPNRTSKERKPLPVTMSPERREVHERALRLGFGAWQVVHSLPAVCAKIRAPVPRWAADLLAHSAALSHEAPPAVIEALLDMSEKGYAWPRTREARRWGIAMGLWSGHTRDVFVWPLGEAVVEAWRARQPPEPEDAPDHAAAWSALGVRYGALVRTANGAVAMVGNFNKRDGSVSLLFRSRSGKARPGAKLTVIANPGEAHPDRAAIVDRLKVPYISRRWPRPPWA